MAVLGGLSSLAGPVFGATALVVLEEVLKDQSVVGTVLAEHFHIPLGIIVVLIVVLFRGGIAGAVSKIGGFELVEGRVLKTARVKGRIYLNFGDDWQDDFTIMFEPAALRRFRAAGIDPLDYQGRRLRVRGWVKSWNGPLILATHPEQIEVLDE